MLGSCRSPLTRRGEEGLRARSKVKGQAQISNAMVKVKGQVAPPGVGSPLRTGQELVESKFMRLI